tara:strand:+ start:132 stop:755 length:624 start_codon:yes stop_codon:yes gene_type:complete
MSNEKKVINLFFSQSFFLGSFNSVDKIFNDKLPECCFIGRSNVGKSSIINSIAKKKQLAKTSKIPGRTQNINIFKVNEKVNLADLPGYGYAKVSKIKKNELSNLIENYLYKRPNLKQVFVLIDCRVGIKDIDIDCLDLINDSNKNFSIILTKIDKCAKDLVGKQNKSLLSFMQNYNNKFNKIFFTSSNKNLGIADLQKEIFNLSKIK